MEPIEWAILEVMGHAIYAGQVTRRVGFVEVIVPETPANPSYEKEFGDGAVFCITPCSESVAIRAAEVTHKRDRTRAIPVSDHHGLSNVEDPMEEIDLDAIHLEEKADESAKLPF